MVKDDIARVKDTASPERDEQGDESSEAMTTDEMVKSEADLRATVATADKGTIHDACRGLLYQKCTGRLTKHA